MKPFQIANTNARQYVQRREPFDGSNLYARTYPANDNCLTNRYVVYSYGSHFPLFIAEWSPEDGKVQWYENTSKYSVTTSKHRSQTHPLEANVLPMTAGAMRTIADWGTAGLAARGEY
jgi:hypothetical protein